MRFQLGGFFAKPAKFKDVAEFATTATGKAMGAGSPSLPFLLPPFVHVAVPKQVAVVLCGLRRGPISRRSHF